MKPIWAIQKFAVNDDDSRGMIDAIHSLGMEHHVLDIPPFDYGNIKPVNYDGPVIPYGGTKFLDSIKNDKGWFCVFNDSFSYKLEVEKLGSRMFNGDGEFMKMGEFCPSMFKDAEYVFIRPDKDTKEFAGNVLEPSELMTWLPKAMDSGWGLNEDTIILVAEASRIDEEWRMFVVDNEVVGGSKYRGGHSLSVSPDVPEEVYDYVREAISIWQPAPFFVMDICRVSNEYSILEIGDLHSAGWYASDKKKIIKAVSEYVEKEYVK